jgi:alpha-aminoadipate carrier protein LysW
MSQKENKTMSTIVVASCPECEADVPVAGTIAGEIVFCPDCGAELEVLDPENAELALAPEVEEDWGE